jgi:hypothetical protein
MSFHAERLLEIVSSGTKPSLREAMRQNVPFQSTRRRLRIEARGDAGLS